MAASVVDFRERQKEALNKVFYQFVLLLVNLVSQFC